MPGLILLAGCSGNPVEPDIQNSAITDNKFVSENPNHHFMGYSLFSIDTETGEMEVIPLRSVDFHLNVVPVLNGTMGVSAKGVPDQADPQNGLFVFDVTLTHPFDNKKFTGFDTRGILLTSGSLQIGPLVFADVDETRLENADGYTRWWNPSEFIEPGIFGYMKGNLSFSPTASLTATINPYKIFADALSSTDSFFPLILKGLNQADSRAVFSAGIENTRRYKIRFETDPGPKVVFGYAVDAAWSMPLVNPPVDIPGDFPITANQPEAFALTVTQPLNTLYYDSEVTAGGGSLELYIDVYDWQGQLTGVVSDQVEIVRLFSPDLWDGGINAEYWFDETEYSRYAADLTGTAVPKSTGDALIAVRVGDNIALDYDQKLGYPAPMSHISAWNVITVTIPELTCADDGNNDFLTAEITDFDAAINGDLCGPVDIADYFLYELAEDTYANGTAKLVCNADGTKLSLYDESQNLILDSTVTGGEATLSVGENMPESGIYYLVVSSDIGADAFSFQVTFTVNEIYFGFTATDITPPQYYFAPDWLYFPDSSDVAYAFNHNRTWIIDTVGKYRYRNHFDVANDVEPAVYGTYIYYFGSDNQPGSSIGLFDAADPDNLVDHPDTISVSNPVTCLYINGDFLYSAQWDGANSQISSYDCGSSPESPVFLNSWQVNYEVKGLYTYSAFAKDYIFILGDVNYKNLDITDPFNEIVDASGFEETGLKYTAFEFNGLTLYLALSDHAGDRYLFSYFKNDPGFGLNQFIIPDKDIENLQVFNGTAYLANSDDSYSIYDVNDPTDMTFITENQSPHDAGINYIQLKSATLYIAEESVGLSRVDLFDPFTPVVLKSYYGMSNPSRIAVDPIFGTLCVVENGEFFRGIKIYNSLSPGNDQDPLLIQNFQSNVTAIAYNNLGYLVVATEAGELNLYNAMDPVNIQFIASGPVPGTVISMAFTDTHIYVGTLNFEINVFDTVGLTAIIPGETEALAGIPSVVTLDFGIPGDYLFITYSGAKNMFAMGDLSNPDDLVIAGEHEVEFPPLDMFVETGFAYILNENEVEVLFAGSPDNISDFASLGQGGIGDRITAWSGHLFVSQPDLGYTQDLILWQVYYPKDNGTFYTPEFYTQIKDIGIDYNQNWLYELVPDRAYRVWKFQ